MFFFCHQGLNEECGLFFNDVEAKIAAHQFCLFFSSGLPQLGEDTEGFDGFLYKDIIKEAQRANKILCKFCQQPGASVGCSLKTCRTSYHYLCGWKQGLQFVFHDCFEHKRTMLDISSDVRRATIKKSSRKKCPHLVFTFHNGNLEYQNT
ncbi:PHD finger protein 6-like isoform X2 [Clytia hemisphaerica]|uniref:PHD finger protein 6-like isoform X2 n=1 Tax=Clytia hemisphaerica TaxID=252671 RepID=UPI0034D61AFA